MELFQCVIENVEQICLDGQNDTIPPRRPIGMSNTFYGRETEIAWLRGMFDAVATKDPDGNFTGPRMAVIVAESGIGKSRIVQELYIRLTNDPQWDPPEVDYWPEAFGDGGVNLRAVPDMKGHVPKGPPRFAWLGARWQSPEERNALARRSVLPEVQSSVMVHAEILKSHGSAWADAASRVSESVWKDGVGESIGAVADLVGIPFFGLVSKLAKGAKDLVADRLAGPKHFEQVESEEIKSEVDEVLECMRLLLNGKGAVPTVLWLDDAQWIDDESQAFVHKLWKEAERRKWPLLIVATHWEREWRELQLAQREETAGGTLHDLADNNGVEVTIIENADMIALRGCLLERLPGLTAAQQLLLVEKAGGNFLTMVENIGELLRHPANFVGLDNRAALASAGEQKVKKWESKREKRVEQRFSELEPEVQDLLGWSSHLGQRFLRDVVVEFASEATQVRDARKLIDRCVDPYVILGAAGEHLREFRDRVFHIVASRHFENYAEEHREVLSVVLRRHLVEWVNNSFDVEGNEIWPDEEKGIAAPERSATGLAAEERRDLLSMAMRELPLPTEPDWTNLEHVAALRAVYLLIITDWRERLWNRVLQFCRPLEGVPFESMPGSVISVDNLEWLVDTFMTAGAYRAAERLAKAALAAHRLAEDGGTPEQLGRLARALLNLGNVLQTRGDLAGAEARYSESIEISRRLAEDGGTPEQLGFLALALSNLGLVLSTLGDLAGAEASYSESIEISRRLTEDGGTPEQLGRLALALSNLGLVLSTLGNVAGAEARYSESIEISRRLTEDGGTPEQLGFLATALLNLGNVFQTRGDLDAALAKYEESLEICRLLAEELGTPESRRDVSISLNKVAVIEQARGDLDAALAKYEESLEIRRLLAEKLGTPVSRRDVSFSLDNVAGIEQACGDLDAALAKYEESLEITRDLLEASGHLSDLNGLVWSTHLVAGCLIACERVAEAMSLLNENSDYAARLEAESGNDVKKLDTCAAYQETQKRAALALGDSTAGNVFTAHGASIRARIERITRGESDGDANA